MNVKKYMKKMFALLLVLCMTVQVFPSSMFSVEASDKTTESTVLDNGKTAKNETTGVEYVSYKDISEYRGTEKSYPTMEGYVFAGWWKGVTEGATDVKDTNLTAVSKSTTEGSAWAKFVPEEVLSVKVQISPSLPDAVKNEKDVSLRLVTSVDSLKYSEVGFKVRFDDAETEYTYGSTGVYSEIKVEDGSREWTETPKSAFHETASTHFATLKIINISAEKFYSFEFAVTPYWVTKDGTTVTGISREEILVSDDLSYYEDGVEFSKEGNAYTLKDASAGNKASYQYFQGASDTIYLKGTYTPSGNANDRFGISIRNGGETRQIFFSGAGVEIVDGVDEGGSVTTSGILGADTEVAYNAYTDIIHTDSGVYVWAGKGTKTTVDNVTTVTADTSAIKTLIDNTTATEVIWVIEDNVLYCSVSGNVVLRLPLEILHGEWQNGRYYQPGVAGYNSSAASIKFECQNLKFGKEAALCLIPESEKMTTTKMAYEPITGSYLSASNASGYAYGTEVNSNTPIAIEMNVGWQIGTEATSYAGLDVKVGEKHTTVMVQPIKNNATYSGRVQIFKNGVWSQATDTYFTEKFTSNPLKKYGESFKMLATVYDEKLSILIDDVTAYEVELKDLIEGYDDTAAISLGITTLDSHNGQAQFSKVAFYEKDAAIAAKTKNWTFYPDTATGITVNTDEGTAIGSDSKMTLAGTSGVWDITGCMTNTTNALQGFEVATADGTKSVQIVRKQTGFAYKANGESWNYDHQNSETDYTIKKQERTNLGNSLLEDNFKIIIANDTLYGWFGEKLQLNWKIPLDNATFGGFEEGTEYSVSLMFGPQNTLVAEQDKFTIDSVKNGIEIKTSLVNTLKSCENMDWKSANTMMTLSTEGEIVTMNTSGNGTRYIYSKSQDNTVWLSGTWKLSGKGTDATGPHDMFGITLSDGANNRQIIFNSKGIAMMASQDGTYRVVRPIENGTSVTSWDYVWGQYTNDNITYSAIDTMLNGNVGDEHKISFAIYQQTLYCSVDGNICLILPLSLLQNTMQNTNFPWNTGADATYKIGFTQWNPSANGHVAVSDVELLYGEEAEAKLNLSGIVDATDNTKMVYSVLDGGYVPRFKSGFAGIYGEASTTVAVESTVQWQDKECTSSAVGVSIKTKDASGDLLSGELLVQGQNQQVRIQNNQGYDAISTESVSQPLYITTDVLEKVTPFDKDGISKIVAKVQDDTLYVKYNEELLDLDETDEIKGIPLSYLLGEGYTAGSSVQIGISTWDAHNGISIIKDLSFKTGTEAEDLYQGKRFEMDATQVWTSNASTSMTYDEKAGTVTRTGNGFAGAYFEGVSQTWEVTGTMSQSEVATLVNQGFTVSAITSDATSVGTRFYMKNKGFAIGGKDSNNAETILNEHYNESIKTTGGAGAAKYYVLNDYTRTYYPETQAMNDIRFRLVIANDILYLWLDDVLSWRIPLTTETFGNYEAGSSYQLGLAAINNSGTVTWKDLRVLSGADVDTSGITKFVVMDDDDRQNLINGMKSAPSNAYTPVYNDVAGTWTTSATEESRLFFVSSDTFESSSATSKVYNGSPKWEVSGTMHNNGAKHRMGVIIADETGAGIAIYGNNAGFMVDKAFDNFSTLANLSSSADFKVSSFNAGEYDANLTLPFFANDNGLRKKSEIDFRFVLVDGVFYAWFDGVLTWKYPLPTSVFGDDAATQAYSIGLVDKEASQAQFSNLTVKSGNEILTGEDFYMRDAFVLADSVEANETVEENGVTVSTEGVYYMYGTRYIGYFDVFTSYDLMTWEKQGRCFEPDDSFWGDAGYYWAPEVYEYTYDGEKAYYMFATFTDMQSVTDEEGNTTSEIAKRGTAVLKADTPLGPFKEWSDGPVTPVDQQCIDGTLYLEDNGDGTKTPYMIYCLEYTDEDADKISGFLTEKPAGLMCYVELSKDLKRPIGNPQRMFNAKEVSLNKDSTLERYVTDGPFAYTTSDGKLLLLWSTFIEGAESSTGLAADAWQYVQLQSKSGNGKLTDATWTYDANAPILYGNATVEQGVYLADNFDGGHGMIFRAFDGQEKMIIHTPNLYAQHYGQGNCLERIKLLDVTYESGYLQINK